MASNSHSQRRAKRAKLEPISIAELAGDSTMTGFSDLFKIPTVPSLSRPSEERPQTAPPAVSSPAPVNSAPHSRSAQVEPLTPESTPIPSEAMPLPAAMSSGAMASGPTDTAPPAVSSPDPVNPAPHSGSAQVEPLTPESTPIPSEAMPLPAATSSGGMASGPADTAPPAVSRTRPIHRCLIAQHGHSSNDQLVYQLLWGQGAPEVNGKPGNRLISIGVAKIARLTGTIHERNVPIILRRLIAKQSIEIVRKEISDQSEARLYRVFSYDEILERRRRLGMEWVIRSSRGVDFVDPITGAPLTPKTAPPAVSSGPAITPPPAITSPPAITTPPAAVSAADPTAPDDNTRPAPPAVSSRIPPAVSSTLLGNGKEKNKETTTSALCEILQARLPSFDDSAVKQLWSACREQVPDVTPSEVSQLFERKLPESRARSITNPVGFLVRAVARSCTPAAVGALRQGRELPKDQPISISSDELEQLLEDPSISPEIRSLIERRLRGES
jgi:hypothetical protein